MIQGMEMIKRRNKRRIHFRMDLTELAVRTLVDYLYTGEIYVESDINILMDVAIAAHCFQLQVCVIISSSSS